MPKTEFCEQGKYLWSLVRKAGWHQPKKGSEISRFDLYIVKTFKATHIEALKPYELRRAIATLKPYAEKADKDRGKQLRQQIMATVAKAGHDVQWLHENMKLWGYGESLRALNFPRTVEVMNCVKKALGVKNG